MVSSSNVNIHNQQRQDKWNSYMVDLPFCIESSSEFYWLYIYQYKRIADANASGEKNEKKAEKAWLNKLSQK